MASASSKDAAVADRKNVAADMSDIQSVDQQEKPARLGVMHTRSAAS